MLLTPQFLGAEAQPHPAGRKVGFQPRQPKLQVSQPPPLPVHLPPLAFFFSLINLLSLTAHPTPQAIQLQKLRLPHRRHLALQRHPHRVEHPSRYPVFIDVLALLRHRRPARRHDGEQLMLHLPHTTPHTPTARHRQQHGQCLHKPRCGSGTTSSAGDNLQTNRQTDGGVSCYEPYFNGNRTQVRLTINQRH